MRYETSESLRGRKGLGRIRATGGWRPSTHSYAISHHPATMSVMMATQHTLASGEGGHCLQGGAINRGESMNESIIHSTGLICLREDGMRRGGQHRASCGQSDRVRVSAKGLLDLLRGGPCRRGEDVEAVRGVVCKAGRAWSNKESGQTRGGGCSGVSR